MQHVLSVVSLGLALAASGCGGTSTRPFVAGPYSLPEHALFERVVEGARSHGYTVADEDAPRGSFVVTAHTTGSRGQTARFIVQCYRPGWFQVTLDGSPVRRTGDTFHMSGALYEEYRDFSVALIEGLVGPGAAAESP